MREQQPRRGAPSLDVAVNVLIHSGWPPKPLLSSAVATNHGAAGGKGAHQGSREAQATLLEPPGPASFDVVKSTQVRLISRFQGPTVHVDEEHL